MEELYRWKSSHTFLLSTLQLAKNTHTVHFSHTQMSEAYLADGGPSLRRGVSPLKAEQDDCRAKPAADSNANHMSTYPGGSQAGTRASSPPSLTLLQAV